MRFNKKIKDTEKNNSTHLKKESLYEYSMETDEPTNTELDLTIVSGISDSKSIESTTNGSDDETTTKNKRSGNWDWSDTYRFIELVDVRKNIKHYEKMISIGLHILKILQNFNKNGSHSSKKFYFIKTL